MEQEYNIDRIVKAPCGVEDVFSLLPYYDLVDPTCKWIIFGDPIKILDFVSHILL